MATLLQFDRFRLDCANQQLDDGHLPIRLNPKAFAVLRTLVERPRQLVTKNDLLDAVWADTHVSDGVLKVCITEIRAALGDSATQPRFIETVHRRGYRFIAPVNGVAPGRAEPSRAGSLVAWPQAGRGTSLSPVGLVGRAPELEALERHVARALGGERQVLFVTGEPGAGKSALIEHFLARLAERPGHAVTGGQCLERFGSAEPYMPVLEAIGRLARADARSRRMLRRCAPTWYAQLPWLHEDRERGRLAGALLGAARERMLREMGELIEALSAEVMLVLVLEDLHWSDPSTVDLLSLLATRREPARLLLIGSYRPVELILARHPLRDASRTLLASRRCEEIALDALGADAVAEYLHRRLPGSSLPAEAATLLRERTDGNPLFLVTLVDHLLAHGVIATPGGSPDPTRELRDELLVVPESVRLLIEQQLERLPADDRALLEAASLVGTEFSAAAAAAAAERATADVEERCALLARAGRFLLPAGTAAWPDGTVAERFVFRHALHRETLAAAVPRGRRTSAHLRIGRVLEEAHGASASELAGALALHFAEAGDPARATRYHRLAGETAAGRFAFREAEAHLDAALVLLLSLPPTAKRDREELALQTMLAKVRQATRGYAAPEVKQGFARALELSAGGLQRPSAFPALTGIWTFYAVSGELDRALEQAERNLAIAEAGGDRLMRLVAHQALWTTHFFRGEMHAALRHLDAGEPLYDPVADRSSALLYGTDPKMGALAYRALALWACGAIDQATEAAREAVAQSRELGHPLTLGRSMVFAAWLRCCRREPDACRTEAEAALAYCSAQALPFWMPHALGLRGWTLVEAGEVERGIAEAEKGLGLWDAIGASCGRSAHDTNLAAIQLQAGDLGAARELLEHAKALAAAGERFHEPEIHRVEADLVLAEAGGAERASKAARSRAEALLGLALDCARRQGALSLELRAATRLARLCRRAARGREARARLGRLYASFSEGLDTADLREARQLLER